MLANDVIALHMQQRFNLYLPAEVQCTFASHIVSWCLNSQDIWQAVKLLSEYITCRYVHIWPDLQVMLQTSLLQS